MNPCAFDTETCLIRPALLAPPMVCLTWQRPGREPQIDHVSDARPRLKSWLEDPSTLLVGHFAAYDAAVICAQFPDLIPLVFEAYRANRITCTKKRQQLLDIAGGVFRGRPGEKGRWAVHNYDLDALSRRLLGKPMFKDGWRLVYDRFLDAPIAKWTDRAREVQAWARVRRAELPPGPLTKDDPDAKEVRALDAIVADVSEGAIRYPLDDAAATLGVYQAQEKHAEPYLRDQYRQAYADFVLYLSSTWGLRTHAAGVAALKAELEVAHVELEGELQALGLVRADGTRNMRAVKDAMIAACKEYGLPIRRTEAHEKCELGDACDEHVSLDSDACEAVVTAAGLAGEADDSPFMAYSEFTGITKMLTNDVKMLESGTVYPVHTRYDLAETGRTTSSKPNIQNLNTGRKGRGLLASTSRAQALRPGVRQAFTPRPGKVFAQADYPQLELYTLAQCCMSWLGHSKLGEALNAGLDPHLAVAANILGISYAEAEANKERDDVDNARQVGKVFNFGKPGGLGAAKLITFARKTYGVILTKEDVDRYVVQWHATFPEMREYFARINALFGADNERCIVTTLFTERQRGGATYCAACNNGFQALGVDCAKAALCLVGEAEYAIPSSPLFGSRTVAFVHDELIIETNDGPGAHDVAFELARLMREGANRYLPDVPIVASKMKPVLMRMWSKKAKQVWSPEKRLMPWAP